MRDPIIRGALVVGVAAAALAGGRLTPAARPVPPAPVLPPAVRLRPVSAAAHGRPVIMAPRGRHPASAGTGGNLAYHGGQVEPAPQVFLLFWGSWWRSSCPATGGNGTADEQYLYSYFHALGGADDGWSPINAQYPDQFGDVPRFPQATWGDWAVDCGTPPQAATNTQLANEAAAYAAFLAGKGVAVGPNTQIMVLSPAGTDPGGGFGTSYCAWHSWISAGGASVPFTNLPYLPGQPMACGAGLVRSSLDGWSIVAGHEFAESATDPFLDGWTDSSGLEIADKCAWTGLFAQDMGGGVFAQQPLWDNNTGGCRASASIPDTVTVGPVPGQATALGAAASVQVTAGSSGGFSLTYTAAGLPAGLSIAPASGLISGKPTWPGNYHVVVTATDPVSATGSTAFSWRVPVPAGTIRTHKTHCVTDSRGSLANGTPVVMGTCGTSLAQQWAAFPDHSLRRYGGPSRISTGTCLALAGRTVSDGTKISLVTCAASWRQRWAYQPASREWVNPHTGKCLDDPGGNLASGTRLVLSTCTGGPGEQWSRV